MIAIFQELIEDSMEVSIDDFFVFGSSFDHYLKNLEKMLKRCEETDFVLNWENATSWLRKEIALGYKLSGAGIETIVFTDHFALRYLFTKQDAKSYLIRWILLLQEFNIEIRDKKDAKNLAADHLSRLENPDLGKLNKAEIRDLFPEERLMAVSDKNNEPCNVPTESYEGASSEMRHHKSFGNVTTDHLEDITVLPLLQEKSLKPVSTSHMSFAMHAGWSKIAMHANEPETSLQGTKHLKSTSNDARNVVNFLKRLFARFGIPKALISDRGTHFCNYQMEKAMKRKDWSYKLDDALWAFQTAFKTPLGATPFRIIYGKACHLPINELDKIRLDAYESSISYKERTKRWHDKRIKAPTNYERDYKGLESVSIRRIQGIGYGVLEFLGVGTTFDIFQNILFPYSLNTAYCLSWIRRIRLVSFVVFGECRHGYAVSSLMDTAYWLSE
ncbi:reverse transcriptase domain-containing protein [Tanacetum coccineum]